MNTALFQQVRDLNLALGTYALFGSAPLGIRNLRECNDVDVIVTDDVWNEYKQKEGWTEKQAPHGDISLCHGDIELWKGWYPGEWNIAELIKTAEMIDGLPFVTLENVVKWKKLKGREKDMSDLQLIDEFLHKDT